MEKRSFFKRNGKNISSLESMPFFSCAAVLRSRIENVRKKLCKKKETTKAPAHQPPRFSFPARRSPRKAGAARQAYRPSKGERIRRGGAAPGTKWRRRGPGSRQEEEERNRSPLPTGTGRRRALPPTPTPPTTSRRHPQQVISLPLPLPLPPLLASVCGILRRLPSYRVWLRPRAGG
jgi:hypothetical protein